MLILDQQLQCLSSRVVHSNFNMLAKCEPHQLTKDSRGKRVSVEVLLSDILVMTVMIFTKFSYNIHKMVIITYLWLKNSRRNKQEEVLLHHSTKNKIHQKFLQLQAINVLSLITMKTSNYRSDLVIHSISQDNSDSVLIVS